VTGSRGSVSGRLWSSTFLARGFFTPSPAHGLTLVFKAGAVCTKVCPYGSVRGCVKNARERNAVPEMKEGPSEPACRSRLQTAVSCCRPMAMVVNVTEKGVSKLRHVWVRETNASEPLMRPRNRSTDGIKTGAPPLSGKSMAETWLLAMRCPGYRWRDSSLGSGMELENLLGGD